MYLQRLVLYTLLLFSPAVFANVCVGPPTAESPSEYANCAEVTRDSDDTFKHIKDRRVRFRHQLRQDAMSPGTAASNLRVISKEAGHVLGETMDRTELTVKSLMKAYHSTMMDEAARIAEGSSELAAGELISGETLAAVGAIAPFQPEIAGLVLLGSFGVAGFMYATGTDPAQPLIRGSGKGGGKNKGKPTMTVKEFHRILEQSLGNIRATRKKLENGDVEWAWGVPTRCEISIVPRKAYISHFTHTNTIAEMERLSFSVNSRMEDLKNDLPREVYNRAVQNLKPSVPRGNSCDYLDYAWKRMGWPPVTNIYAQTLETTNIAAIVRKVIFSTRTGQPSYPADTLYMGHDVHIKPIGRQDANKLLISIHQRGIGGGDVTGFIYRGRVEDYVNVEYVVMPNVPSKSAKQPVYVFSEGNVIAMRSPRHTPSNLFSDPDYDSYGIGLFNHLEAHINTNYQLTLFDILHPEQMSSYVGLNYYNNLKRFSNHAIFEIADSGAIIDPSGQQRRLQGLQFNQVSKKNIPTDGIFYNPNNGRRGNEKRKYSPSMTEDTLLSTGYFNMYGSVPNIAWRVKSNDRDTYTLLSFLYMLYRDIFHVGNEASYNLLTGYIATKIRERENGPYVRPLIASASEPWVYFADTLEGKSTSHNYFNKDIDDILTFRFWDAFKVLVSQVQIENKPVELQVTNWNGNAEYKVTYFDLKNPEHVERFVIFDQDWHETLDCGYVTKKAWKRALGTDGFSILGNVNLNYTLYNDSDADWSKPPYSSLRDEIKNWLKKVVHTSEVLTPTFPRRADKNEEVFLKLVKIEHMESEYYRKNIMLNGADVSSPDAYPDHYSPGYEYLLLKNRLGVFTPFWQYTRIDDSTTIMYCERIEKNVRNNYSGVNTYKSMEAKIGISTIALPR